MSKQLLLLLALMGLNFAVQSVNFWELKEQACSLYVFDSTCLSLPAFIMNKVIRLSLNIFILHLVNRFFWPHETGKFYLAFLILILFAIIDLTLCQGAGFWQYRAHGILHPMAFSPLLAIVLIAARGLR